MRLLLSVKLRALPLGKYPTFKGLNSDSSSSETRKTAVIALRMQGINSV